jgi:AIPR protein
VHIEEVRSLIQDGNLPRVRVLLCSNGASWKVPEAQALIDRVPFGDRVSFQHVNHDTLVHVLGNAEPISETIRFTGKILVDDLNYVRVLIGKVPVTERSGAPLTSSDITVATAAEAVLAVWRERPQRAKFRGGDHFGALYDDIFARDLTGAQVVSAVLLFRVAENKRKLPPSGTPEFVRYASYFIAMLMGRMLLADLGIELSELDHRHFDRARESIDQNAEVWLERALSQIDDALTRLYGGQEISAHRLAGTFRRGDLFDYLGAPAGSSR